MKTSNLLFFSISVAILFSCMYFPGGIKQAEAKSKVWSTTIAQGLAYRYGHRSGFDKWSLGFLNPNVSITYLATVTDASTGAVVNDLANVPVGTRLKFTPTPFRREHISWFGTGYTVDSPYGSWIPGATHPGVEGFCSSQNYLERSGMRMFLWWSYTVGNDIDIYGNFSVNPPTVSVTHTGSTASLSCNTDNTLCTVNSSGSIRTQITFASTYGKFYYGYWQLPWPATVSTPCTPANLCNICVTHTTPMRIISTVTNTYSPIMDLVLVNGVWQFIERPPLTVVESGTSVASSEYILTIPTQTISFTQTAVDVNNPPNPPTLTGPTTGTVNISYSFSARTTDPDNDTVRYGFDWNNDGTVDVWTPYVSSGTARSAAYTWSTVGEKRLKVRAQDSKGLLSAWSPVHVITISLPPVPNPSLVFTASRTSITQGESANLVWVTSNTSSCTASGGWTGAKNPAGGSETVSPTVTTTYRLQCQNSAGVLTPSQFKTIVVTAPAPSLTFTASQTYIQPGDGVVLSWLPSNVTSCTATGGWSGGRSVTSNNEMVVPHVTTTYELECWNISGVSTGKKSQTVQVQLGVTLEDKTAPYNVGDTVRWTATGRGGKPPYTFSWSDAITPSSNGNPITGTYKNWVQKVLSAVGTENAHVVVTDANGDTASADSPIQVEENRSPQ